MGVGYAVVSQRLTIGGTAKMQGVWDVRITNIQLSRKRLERTWKNSSKRSDN